MNRISILLAVCCSQLLHGNSSFQPTFTFQVTRGEFNDTVRVRQNRQMKGEKFCKRMNGIYNNSHTCICVHPTPLLTSTKSGTLRGKILSAEKFFPPKFCPIRYIFLWKKNSGRPVCSNRDNLRSLSCVGNDFRSVLCTATSSQFTSRIAFRNANHEHCTQVHVWNVMERRPRPTGSGRTIPTGRGWRNRTPYAEVTASGSPWVGGWVNVTGTEAVNYLKVNVANHFW